MAIFLFYLTGQSCDSYFTTLTGTLTSPNYPSNYPNNADCSFVIDIQHTGATSVVVRFNDFQLEDRYDLLYFGQGTHVGNRILGSFTGPIIPDDLEVLGNQMWFYFESDFNVAARGFSIEWQGRGNSNSFLTMKRTNRRLLYI